MIYVLMLLFGGLSPKLRAALAASAWVNGVHNLFLLKMFSKRPIRVWFLFFLARVFI